MDICGPRGASVPACTGWDGVGRIILVVFIEVGRFIHCGQYCPLNGMLDCISGGRAEQQAVTAFVPVPHRGCDMTSRSQLLEFPDSMDCTLNFISVDDKLRFKEAIVLVTPVLGVIPI